MPPGIIIKKQYNLTTLANNTFPFSVSAGGHFLKCRLKGHGGGLLTLSLLSCECQPKKYGKLYSD